MRYKINSPVAYTRKMKIRVFLKWFLYFLSLIVFYSIMSCGIFRLWAPYLIIPLAIAVSMREAEFSSSVFGIVCGFMLDISIGTLFGFFAVWLMPCCFITSLFSRNLIKINFLNHIIFTAVSTMFSFVMYYLFNFIIWNVKGRGFIISNILVPSFFATIVVSPAIYFLIKLISRKLGIEDSTGINEAIEDAIDKSEEAKD